jgi:hypothetical protein
VERRFPLTDETGPEPTSALERVAELLERPTGDLQRKADAAREATAEASSGV